MEVNHASCACIKPSDCFMSQITIQYHKFQIMLKVHHLNLRKSCLVSNHLLNTLKCIHSLLKISKIMNTKERIQPKLVASIHYVFCSFFAIPSLSLGADTIPGWWRIQQVLLVIKPARHDCKVMKPVAAHAKNVASSKSAANPIKFIHIVLLKLQIRYQQDKF